jgi:hypothetical protein
MSAPKPTLIPVPDQLVQQLPRDLADRQKVRELGLKQWHIRKALEVYERGECSIEAAARLAGVSLRAMIPAAYARGLRPNVDPAWLSSPLTLEEAAEL